MKLRPGDRGRDDQPERVLVLGADDGDEDIEALVGEETVGDERLLLHILEASLA